MDFSSLPPMQPEQLGATIRHLLADLELPDADRLSLQDIEQLLFNLPRLTKTEVVATNVDTCPICFVTFDALLSEEETAIAMDSPAHPIEELGVTSLSQTWQCNHAFCRRDISTWIKEGHDSCPLCRKNLVDPSQTTSTPSAEAHQVGAEDLAQFQERLVSFFGTHLQNASSQEAEENSREEFSGMYS